MKSTYGCCHGSIFPCASDGSQVRDLQRGALLAAGGKQRIYADLNSWRKDESFQADSLSQGAAARQRPGRVEA
jgi:hypothetical protein